MAKLALNNIVNTAATTTDATPTVIATFDTSFVTNAAFSILVNVLAFDTSGNDEVGNYVIAATFKRQAGSLAIVGTATALHTAENTVAWACTVTASGNNITVTGTGAAATNIQWNVNATVTNCVLMAVRGDN